MEFPGIFVKKRVTAYSPWRVLGWTRWLPCICTVASGSQWRVCSRQMAKRYCRNQRYRCLKAGLPLKVAIGVAPHAAQTAAVSGARFGLPMVEILNWIGQMPHHGYGCTAPEFIDSAVTSESIETICIDSNIKTAGSPWHTGYQACRLRRGGTYSSQIHFCAMGSPVLRESKPSPRIQRSKSGREAPIICCT